MLFLHSCFILSLIGCQGHRSSYQLIDRVQQRGIERLNCSQQKSCGELLSVSDSRPCFTEKRSETLKKTHSIDVVFLINSCMKNNLNFQLKNYCNYSIFIRFFKLSIHGNKPTEITLSAEIAKLVTSCCRTG